MKWMRERDALIAQTLTFVRSVAGRRDDAGEPLLRSTPEQTQPDAAPLEPANVETVPAQAVEAIEPPEDPPAVRPPIVSSSVRAEFQTRIAGFRAHQERFSRERAEYFSTTLSKLRAAIDGSPPLRPRE